MPELSAKRKIVHLRANSEPALQVRLAQKARVVLSEIDHLHSSKFPGEPEILKIFHPIPCSLKASLSTKRRSYGMALKWL